MTGGPRAEKSGEDATTPSLMESEINQLHGVLDESGVPPQPLGGISCSAPLARPDKDR